MHVTVCERVLLCAEQKLRRGNELSWGFQSDCHRFPAGCRVWKAARPVLLSLLVGPSFPGCHERPWSWSRASPWDCTSGLRSATPWGHHTALAMDLPQCHVKISCWVLSYTEFTSWFLCWIATKQSQKTDVSHNSCDLSSPVFLQLRSTWLSSDPT